MFSSNCTGAFNCCFFYRAKLVQGSSLCLMTRASSIVNKASKLSDTISSPSSSPLA
jgi:hypothetical protein